MPPKPPGMKSSIASAAPANTGSRQGKKRTVFAKPRTPARRAASSKVAKMANAVMNDGMTTPYVNNMCSHFQPAEIPGSTN